jgi:hypothetical protein
MQESYDQLLPIHGKTFEIHEGTWRASVTNRPNPIGAWQRNHAQRGRCGNDCPCRDMRRR